VTAGIGYVDPQEDDPRVTAGGGLSGYSRFDVEIYFETLAFQMGGNEINFSGSDCYYQKIDDKSSVKSAGLDDFDYMVLTLGPN
jgi:hypothetical protein